jgi:transcriptional regulator with XRE-family HTH domain
MDDAKTFTGTAVAKLRKKKKLSQEDLAYVAKVSQATISRIEKNEQVGNLQTLGKIAQALGVALSEIVPPEALPPGDDDKRFFAFCDNAFCDQNYHYVDKDKAPWVRWKSYQSYSPSAWPEVNFCKRCGTGLTKECPSCKTRLHESNINYCTRCGTRISPRPTKDEWERIAALAQPEPED